MFTKLVPCKNAIIEKALAEPQNMKTSYLFFFFFFASMFKNKINILLKIRIIMIFVPQRIQGVKNCNYKIF